MEKMKLTIETKNKYRAGDIENAYNYAMKSTTRLPDFMKSLEENIGDSEIGRGGDHVWISEKESGERIAFVENLFN